MKYILITLAVFQITMTSGLSAQSVEEETCFLTMVVPPHFIKKSSEGGVDFYESKSNRSLLTMSKAYKSAEDGFLSAQSAADHLYQQLTSDEKNIEVNVVSEKIGKVQFTNVSWIEKGERRSSRNYMRGYNDDGQFIHYFEMSSATGHKKQLDKAFRSFLRTCRPAK